jgi:predicted Zn-dependent peptidase
LRDFLGRQYVAQRMVLSAAGAVVHEEIVRHAEALFGGLNGGAGQDGLPAQYVGGLRSSAKPFEQSHLVLGFKGPSYREPDYLTAQVLSGMLGGGMSSRLFQEVRESRGLCYAIYSSAWGLSDGGMFAVHAATGAELMGKLIEVVVHEIEKAADTLPEPVEVARAKAQLKAGLLMSLESSSARAEQMARQLLAYERLIPPKELIERVDAVTAEGTRACAEGMLRSAGASVAVVGAGQRSEEWAGVAGRLLERSRGTAAEWRS